GPLTSAERRLMQTHTVLGEQLLEEVPLLRDEGLLVVRSHHERWDGRGYPDRLAEDAIPLGARIFAVADTLDAITSDRPYRRAGAWDAAVAEIVRLAGKQFDPVVALSMPEPFAQRLPGLRRIVVFAAPERADAVRRLLGDHPLELVTTPFSPSVVQEVVRALAA